MQPCTCCCAGGEGRNGVDEWTTALVAALPRVLDFKFTQQIGHVLPYHNNTFFKYMNSSIFVDCCAILTFSFGV